jgi:DNA polymerase elongation subunit (family B)
MDKYYKRNYIKNKYGNNDNDIEFEVIEWHAQDESLEDDDDDNEVKESCKDLYTIRCFGVTEEGVSVTCKITDFTPFYYVKVDNSFNKVKLSRFLRHVEESWQLQKKVEDEDGNNCWVKYYNDCLLKEKCGIVKKKDLYGFTNGEEYTFIRLVFSTNIAMNKSKYIFKKAISIEGINKDPVKYKLYESNFEPFMRFCHIKDIRMAGWIKLPGKKYVLTDSEATTQVETQIQWKNVISLPSKTAIGNFLQASWDIETYSFDGSFPIPDLKNKKAMSSDIEELYPNVIYQLATTFKYYLDKKTLVKHLLTLKKCNPIPMGEDNIPVIVEECKNERELILRWVELISHMDPDILYTYNGDTFDCMYIYERAKLYKIDKIVEGKLSRVNHIPTTIKKETFSSSAYGDSDFMRFYIPGRLNYDLLIHYKRGMKKYPSYKLDFISNEILKEGKHEVTAKEIFSYYRQGEPEQIAHIGRYCIQDTELLQKLVDKQLILITIIQLANVTFVPIGFLTTRGQTIKVFSQILRKARMMNFLVPHTNFNEDSYPIHVKCSSVLELDIGDIGEYVEINCGKSQGHSPKNKRDTIVNGKISEIISDTEFVVLSDVEITHDYFNVKGKLRFGSKRDFLVSRIYSGEDLVDDSFTGATVLEAKSGMYTENIAVLDFASLYPTIMISRNLCYSTFVMDDKYKNLPGVKYETMAWDDKVEYKLKHTCEGIGKTGKSKDQVCGKQAYFEVTQKSQLEYLQREINTLNNELEELDEDSEKLEIKKMKTKIKTKEKELKSFSNSINLLDNVTINLPRYFCRTHDPIKNSREPSEKYQKKDVSYNFTVVQPHTETDSEGNLLKVNQGVLPALLEELYAERKAVKKKMAKAAAEGNKLLEDICNSTQLAIKVSLNSVYGYLGRGQGNLILKELGSIVTSVGRKLIEQSKEYAEGPFLEYIKEQNLATHTVRKIELDMSDGEKDIILKQFKV